MNSTVRQYETADLSLIAVVDSVPAGGWANPSTCAGWTARDVLRHVIETQREFLIGRDVDLGDSPDVDGDPATAWRNHAKRVVEAMSDDDVAATAYDGHFGPTTIGATLERFYVWDMIVHRWDIARSFGGDDLLSDADLDQIERGIESFGDALYMDGICGPPVEVSADADRRTRVLARLGRRA